MSSCRSWGQADRLRQEALRRAPAPAVDPAVASRVAHPQLADVVAGVKAEPVPPAYQRAPVPAAFRRAEVPAVLGQQPVRLTLEDLDLGGAGGCRRDDLHGRGTRAEHAHPQAGQVEAFGPLGRVADYRGDAAVLAGQGRDARDAQEPDRADDGSEAPVRPARGRGDHVLAPVVVPGDARHLLVQHQVAPESERVHDALEVTLQLILAGVGPAPVRRGVGERVDVRLEVHLGAGVAVVPPRPAHAQGALEDDEVLQALPLQGDAGRDPAEAGPITATRGGAGSDRGDGLLIRRASSGPLGP